MNRMIEGVSVIFDPNKKIADKGEVLVGLGDTGRESKGIVLQHKTQAKRYASLSQYVAETDFDSLNAEKCCKHIYIEDFSVDTVVTIWIFLYKIHQKNIPENINTWIDYSKRWEKGDTSTTGKAFESYGCLQNALALSQRSLQSSDILSSSLSFLDSLLSQGISPSNIPASLSDSYYELAYQALEKEYQKYENIIRGSDIEVLFIPGKSSGKAKKISAIFIQAEIISSIQKVFLRNDSVNAPTKDGFGLMAVYNPQAEGTGNDIVISVDPLKEIYLKELWAALEEEENRLWQGKRSRDNPRPLKSYPDGDGPNEPWWDDMGNYTLIASPKRIGSELGRRVSWKTVREFTKYIYLKGANK